MSRNSHVRHRILEYLSLNGPVRDPSGRATSVLKDAVRYTGSPAGFTQLVAQMGNAGELERDVRGKRTYEVRCSRPVEGLSKKALSSLTTGSLDSDGQELDYDELAATLLELVTRLITRSENAKPATWPRRRVEQLETRNAVIERELTRVRSELNLANAERDELKEQLETAQRNLDLFGQRTDGRQGAGTPATDHLGPDDKALLRRLTGRRADERRSEQAG